MTLDELLAREAIRATICRYNACGDNDDADGFAACFASDGIIESIAFRHEGREAIREWKASAGVFSATGRTAPFRVHNVTGSHIEMLSAETARARSGWIVITDIGPDHAGVYHDQFRKEGEDWLIAHRVIDLLWRAPNSYVGEQGVGRKSAVGRNP